MKILAYLTPWDENIKSSALRYSFLKNDFKAVLKNLYSYCDKIKEDFEARIICPNITGAEQNDFSESYITPHFINKKEINYIFSSHKEYMMSKDKKEELISFFNKKLNSFTPDIIIAITPCEFFKEQFSKSLYFSMEAGFFSRPPYPITQYFDTNSSLNKTFPVQFKDQILKLNFNQKQQNFINLIRKKYTKFFNNKLPITRGELNPGNKYKNILLLPLQFENCHSFDLCCDFKDQTTLVKFVLKNISKDILLVITIHQFTDLNIKKLTKELNKGYDNFLFIERLNSMTNNLSQYLLHLVDGVVTVSSSIGMQAALFNKPCISIGSSHINAFSDYNNLDNIDCILTKQHYSQEKDQLIYYLLTHYYIPFKFLKKKPKWTYNFFKKSMKKNINFKGEKRIDFYDRIESDGNLLKFYLKSRFAGIIYYLYNMIK